MRSNSIWARGIVGYTARKSMGTVESRRKVIMKGKMSNAEYIATQQQLLLMASLIKELNLDGFLARIKTAYALGPILDPTLYKKSAENVETVHRIAVAARNFQMEVKKVTEEEAVTRKVVREVNK